MWSGTFVKEKDMFLTTNIVVWQDLEKIPKYEKYKKVIQNIRKNLEKFVFSTNLSYYVGNDQIKNMRKKMIVKDVIELLLLHNDYLKNEPKDRIQSYAKKYGILQDFTRLFFFELKNEIFVTSAEDTDQFKMIKYNNILTYMILMIILDLNPGQILSLKSDKICNFYRFKLLKEQIFGKIYIRMSEKDKMPITKLPLFCFIIYYFTCILVGNFHWLSNRTNVDGKKSKTFDSNLHIIAIHTIIDLVNSIQEANFKLKDNYLYQILSTRINDKLENLYSDKELLDRLEEESKQQFKIENKTIKKVVNEIPFIVNNDNIIAEQNTNLCDSTVRELKREKSRSYDNDLNQTTNCPDGKYHIWKLEGNDLVCSLCNLKFNKLKKESEETSSVQDYQHIINQLKYDYYKKMLDEYCISGEIHDFPSDSQICTKCKINPFTHKYTDKEIDKFEKNIRELDDKKQVKMVDNMKERLKNKENEKTKSIKIIKKFEKRFETNTKDKLINYIDDFIDKLVKIVGKNPKIDEKEIQIKETTYFIDHDYLGNEKKNGIIIYESEKKIIHDKENKNINKNVYYYKDRSKNITVYYDAITLQYLGYLEDNKFYKGKSFSYLKINYSVRDKLLLLGLNSKYIRAKEIVKTDNNSELITRLVELRVLNLKYIILRIMSIIYRIKNNKRENSFYGEEEKKIVNSFIKTIKKFSIRNDENKKQIFKHAKYILNKTSFDKVPENIKLELNEGFVDVRILDSLNNLDSKLLFFLVYNFNRLINYNSNNNI